MAFEIYYYYYTMNTFEPYHRIIRIAMYSIRRVCRPDVYYRWSMIDDLGYRKCLNWLGFGSSTGIGWWSRRQYWITVVRTYCVVITLSICQVRLNRRLNRKLSYANFNKQIDMIFSLIVLYLKFNLHKIIFYTNI